MHRTSRGKVNVLFESVEMPTRVSCVKQQHPGGEASPAYGKRWRTTAGNRKEGVIHRRESVGLVAKRVRLMKSLRKDAIGLKGEEQVETGRLYNILFLNYLYHNLIRVLVTATDALAKCVLDLQLIE